MANYFIRKSILNKILAIDSCQYCGSDEELWIDHIIPRSKGGNGEIENLTRACRRCNTYKSDFLIPVFVERIQQKRINSMSDFKRYASLYRRAIKRGWPIDRILDYVSKIHLSRANCSYYTRIIHSITLEKYKYHG